MIANAYNLSASDGSSFHVYEWLPEKSNVRGIIQIVHGMAEHAGRYADFASFLTDHGFVVFANDHRGHGKTAGSTANLGKCENWDKLNNDLKMVSNYAAGKFPGKPFFIIGHSMGSFLTRKYMLDKDFKPIGAVILGTADSPGFLGLLGILITKITKMFYSHNTPGTLLYKMSFGAYNKPFEPKRTNFDWLTRDNNQVDKYICDPYCGAILSISFFNWLLKTLMFINLKMNFDATPKKLPVLVISGDSDPVGNFGKGVTEVYTRYKKAGLNDLELKLYPGGRHELLNETNKNEVYQFIQQWLDARLKLK